MDPGGRGREALTRNLFFLDSPLDAHNNRDSRLDGSGPMETLYIKFNNEADRARGYYELIRFARVLSLTGRIYGIPPDALGLLDGHGLSYRRASDAEVQAAHDQIRNPPAVVL